MEDNKQILEGITKLDEKITNEVDTVKNEVTDLKKQISDLNRFTVERQTQFSNSVPENKIDFGQSLYDIYSRKEIEIKLDNTVGNETTDSEGGYIAPKKTGNSLYQSPNDAGLARRISKYQPILGKSQEFYTIDTDLTVTNTRVEGGAVTASNLGYNVVTLTPQSIDGLYVFTKELERDAVVNLQEEVRTNFIKQINVKEDALLVTRLEALPVANGLTASVTGTLKASVTSLDIFPQLIALVEGNNSADGNYCFIANPSTYWYFYELKKTTGDPMINFDTATQTLFVYGKPMYKTNRMSGATVTTSGKVVLAYGDFDYCYFGEKQGITIERANEATVGSTNLWTNRLVGVMAHEDVDIQFIDKNKFGVYRLK